MHIVLETNQVRKRYKCRKCNPGRMYYRKDENTAWMDEVSFKKGIQKFKCAKCGSTTELDYNVTRGIF